MPVSAPDWPLLKKNSIAIVRPTKATKISSLVAAVGLINIPTFIPLKGKSLYADLIALAKLTQSQLSSGKNTRCLILTRGAQQIDDEHNCEKEVIDKSYEIANKFEKKLIIFPTILSTSAFLTSRVAYFIDNTVISSF